MAEYSDFLYYKDKQINPGLTVPDTNTPQVQSQAIHITLPSLKRPQSTIASPPFSFQTTNFYAQHINELATSPPTRTMPNYIELQPVLDCAPSGKKADLPLSKEALKRCKNCGQYYKEKDNITDKVGAAPCRYHPGKYQAPITSQHMGSFPMWSCCKNEEQAPGCRIQSHVEDTEASKSLTLYDELRRTFGQHEDQPEDEALIDFAGLGPVPGSTRTIKHGRENDTQKKDVSKGDENQETRDRALKPRVPVRVSSAQLNGTDLIHYVKMTDTLYGLALKYDVSVADIKALNKMPNDNIYSYTQLLIPRKPDEVEVDDEVPQEDIACRQAQMINRFKRTQRVSYEEALYYLDICEWNYEEAVKEREGDVNFEKAASSSSQAQKVW